MLFVRWLLSGKVRHACEMGRHARRLLRAQQDLLAPESVTAVGGAIHDLRSALRAGAGTAEFTKLAQELDTLASQHLRPYPRAAIRENIEVILVAIAVALAIRTFFLQPFKIPTGSMQPTLFGITVENLADKPGAEVPGFFGRWRDSWGKGTSYIHLVAESDGPVSMIEPPKTLIPFISRQRFRIGGATQTLWFPPSTLPARGGVPPHLLLFAHGGVQPDRVYKTGETILKLKVSSGDHLFVDRVSFNFRRPTRGEIIVFETKGIQHPMMPQDQFYIKRMVGMGPETLQIGEDRHLVASGKRLDASVPPFENVYSFDPDQPPRESQFSGHVRLPDYPVSFNIRPNHYFVMGDNTLNSFDSRMWNDFSCTNVIGKYCFVYWPFHSRFGWAAR